MVLDSAFPLFQLISHLHDVVLRRDEAGNPIETKLHQISSDLYTVITNNLQVGVGQVQAGEGRNQCAAMCVSLGTLQDAIRCRGCHHDH